MALNPETYFQKIDYTFIFYLKILSNNFKLSQEKIFLKTKTKTFRENDLNDFIFK